MNEHAVNNNQNTEEVRWYQVPVLWIALLLFAGMVFGCIHLIVLSSDLETKRNVEGEKYILGVPVNNSGVIEEFK